jgi:antitoxin (DNA-binding transcriptional repressor) of toxin-antitoxin stability system
VRTIPIRVHACYGPVVADDTSVSVRELRSNLSRYLARANAGETITVTRAGRVDAELGPPTVEETTSDGDD